MPGQGRLGDKANVPIDSHGCPACPHPGTGPAVLGSADVFVNKRPALRVDDVGFHAACCGTNTWQAKTGSETVFINGRAAHRQTDRTKHCGGNGQLVEGSPNVIVGDTSASPAGGGSSASASSTGRGSSASASSTGRGSSASASSSGTGSSASASPTSSGSSPSPSAADAHGAGSPDPNDPVDPDIDPDPETVHLEAQAGALRAAAEAHVPFCAECERARAGM